MKSTILYIKINLLYIKIKGVYSILKLKAGAKSRVGEARA